MGISHDQLGKHGKNPMGNVCHMPQYPMKSIWKCQPLDHRKWWGFAKPSTYGGLSGKALGGLTQLPFLGDLGVNGGRVEWDHDGQWWDSYDKPSPGRLWLAFLLAYDGISHISHCTNYLSRTYMGTEPTKWTSKSWNLSNKTTDVTWINPQRSEFRWKKFGFNQ